MYTDEQYSPSAITGAVIALIAAGLAGILGATYLLALLTFVVAFCALGVIMPYSRM